MKPMNTSRIPASASAPLKTTETNSGEDILGSFPTGVHSFMTRVYFQAKSLDARSPSTLEFRVQDQHSTLAANERGLLQAYPPFVGVKLQPDHGDGKIG